MATFVAKSRLGLSNASAPHHSLFLFRICKQFPSITGQDPDTQVLQPVHVKDGLAIRTPILTRPLHYFSSQPKQSALIPPVIHASSNPLEAFDDPFDALHPTMSASLVPYDPPDLCKLYFSTHHANYAPKSFLIVLCLATSTFLRPRKL